MIQRLDRHTGLVLEGGGMRGEALTNPAEWCIIEIEAKKPSTKQRR